MNVSKIAKNGLLYTQTGTPYYASPEVWKDQPYDAKSDIWSFGCVIYEMTTLEPPFKANDMEGLFETVTAGIYPPIPSFYSKELASVIKLMLQQNPSSRPNTDKLLKSSLFLRKISDLNISNNEEINTELLKTIRIPNKIHYLTDRLPKSNYDSINQSEGLSRKARKSTLPAER
jgi:NIMA (never in mitosis gene a)-related kinase